MYIFKSRLLRWLIVFCAFSLGSAVAEPRSKVALGRYLFNDVRLSKLGNRSCALCHSPYHGWSNTFSKTPDIYGKLATLNTPSLLNVADYSTYMQGTTKLTSLVETIKRPLLSKHPEEMGMEPALLITRLKSASDTYSILFENAFGSTEVTLDKVLFALAEYVKTIRSTDTPYHQYLQTGNTKLLTVAQQKGLTLFNSERLNCRACHGGQLLNNRTAVNQSNFANTGLYGIQSGDKYYYPAEAQGLENETGSHHDNGKFRIPSLVNVTKTGPWGHDGSFATLTAVIESYARGGRLTVSGPNKGDGRHNAQKDPLIKGFSLTNAEKSQLLSFLNALTVPAQNELSEHASPFCALVTLKGREDIANCIPPFVYRD
ncbi:cytochrome-c peroxidase [Moritella sp. 28]|uniref:cytochrome-c peroxidase n=1 Tax=Moritella sp. 28 TaxID=2746232 RepID=UPI001BA461A0|nr:cytochrome c peroxidase [Moritella sp. 28]QUM86343.1 cytochrome-c peroxidase [Moritella sp. 28]